MKIDIKGHMLNDSSYIKCSEETNPQRQEAEEWWPGLGPGRMGVSANRDRAPFHRDGSGLELKSGDGYLTM